MSARSEQPVVLRHALGRTVSVIVWVLTAAWLTSAGWPPSLPGLMFVLSASAVLLVAGLTWWIVV